MKIGIFTDVYNPITSGVVTSINMVEQEMKRRGHEVYIFTTSKSTQPNGNNTLYMVDSVPLLIARQYKNRLATFYSREVAKQIKEIGIDIVHTQDEFSLGAFGRIMARKMDIPFIHTYHTMWEDYVHYITPIKHGKNIHLKHLARKLSKAFVAKAECVIAPSNKTAKYLKYKCNIKNKPIYVIPTGIDIKPFSSTNFTNEDRATLKKSLGIEEDEKVILFLGRIAQEKSIDILLNQMPALFKEYEKCKFVIAGEGPSRKELQELAKKLKIDDRVIFTGRIPWAEVPKYYNAADVFVNASLTETQGLTFIEAMAAGIPIVCKYAPNLSEFITNEENALMVRKDTEFKDAILRIFSDNALKDKIVENELKTAQEYSLENFGDKLEMVYSEIIELYKKKKGAKDREERNKQKKTVYNRIKNKLKNIAKK